MKIYLHTTYSISDVQNPELAAFHGISKELWAFMANPPEEELLETWVLSDGLTVLTIPKSKRDYYPDAGWPTHIVIWEESEVHLFNYGVLDYCSART